MAMTILERLASEKPRGRKICVLNETLKPIYRLIHHHMAEIEEAQSRGYSWRQINEVCRELWQDNPEAKKIIWWKKPMMIAECYHRIKKGQTPSRINPIARKKTTAKKYSIAVTEE